MGPVWKPMTVTVEIVYTATTLAMLLLTLAMGLVAHLYELLIVPVIFIVCLAALFRATWPEQRARLGSHYRDGIAADPVELVSAVEAALRTDGLGPRRREGRGRLANPGSEMFDLSVGLTVTVHPHPRGHTVYVGPVREGTRTTALRVERVVDRAIAMMGSKGDVAR